jgi:Major tropism determinant N-terminal domain
MSLQIRRGTGAQLANITPVVGEMIYTTDTKQVFVGDGSTAGGIPIAVGGGGTVTANLVGNVTGSLNGVLVSVSGNVITGNILAGGYASVAGNITGSYLIGNGSQLTGITSAGTRISNGNTEVNIGASAGNANISVNGTSNVVVVANTGAYVTGLISASGNVIGSTVKGTTASVSGNITGGNLLFGSGIVSGTGNISAGIISVTTASASGNIIGGNIRTGGLISAAGNIYSNATVRVTDDIAVGGNISTTNLTGTLISVIGNVTGNYILGNGSQLSGIVTGTPTTITNGTSNVSIPSIDGNVLVSVNGTYNIATFTSTGEFIQGILSASGNIIGGNLNAAGLVSGTTISASGNVIASGNVTGGNLLTSGRISATATIIGGNLSAGSGYISTSGNVTGGNIITSGVLLSTNTISAVGNIVLDGQLTVNSGGNTTAIVNGGTNGSGNIGASGAGFDTVFAKATTAQYADLAECYLADAYYIPGTVVSFGGPNEITFCNHAADTAVAGVVSTQPAYTMNSGLKGEHVVMVALMGRVPCAVQGPIQKGALLVSAGNGRAQAHTNPDAGTIIGKALESFDGDVGTIEIVVGRV